MAATKRNRTQQPEEAPELQPEQWACIASLLAGATDEAAASAAGVSRATVQRWKSDTGFRAALNGERLSAWNAHRDKLRGLLGKSLAVLDGALSSPDERLRVQAALKLLAAAGELWVKLPPTGGTTKAAVEYDLWRDALAEGI